MTEFEIYLRNQTTLGDDDMQKIINLAVRKILKRNELLLESGKVSHQKVFIVKGLLRSFSIAPDGNEHILQFSPENSWTLDVESYNLQVPSKINIGAIEETTVLLWNKNDFQTLLASIPEFKSFSEQLISRNIYHSRHRLLTTLSATPEERYTDFVKTSPNLVSRLPLRMIASYLGISLKTLNRVRQAQLQQS